MEKGLLRRFGGLPALVLAGCPPALATPPPMPQTVADCRSPVYASDTLVCTDEGLRRHDAELAALLPVRGGPPLAIEPQEDWFRRSRMCAMRADHRACLAAAHAERIAVLRAARTFDAATAPWRASRCTPDAAELAELPGGIVAVRRRGVVSLALTGVDAAVWTPYVHIEPLGAQRKVRWLDGSAIRCRIVARR